MFGSTSGAHFNLAVTLAFYLSKEIGGSDALWYAQVQVVGAILGVWLAHVMFDTEVIQFSDKLRTGVPQWTSEVVATAGLVGTIMITARVKPDAVALSVGLYITAAYWFTASTSFANPAVSVARCLTNTFSGIRPIDVLPSFSLSSSARCSRYGFVAGIWMNARIDTCSQNYSTVDCRELLQSVRAISAWRG